MSKFLCKVCDKYYSQMWGDTCNACREVERRHQETIAANDKMVSKIENLSFGALDAIAAQRDAALKAVDFAKEKFKYLAAHSGLSESAKIFCAMTVTDIERIVMIQSGVPSEK